MTKRDFIGWLLYHTVRPFAGLPDALSIYFHNPSTEAFERMARWIIAEGYQFGNVDDLCGYVLGNEPSVKKIAVITLDDAWQGNVELLPVIEKYQIPVTIFAPVEPLIEGNYWWERVQKKGGVALANIFKEYDEERFKTECEKLRNEMQLSRSAMTIEQLRTLSEHPMIEIGGHSYSHPILTKVSDSNLEHELKESKLYLQNLLGKEIKSFSYPNGSYTEREAKVVKENYRCAFTVVQQSPRKGGDIYAIPRFAMTNDFWSNLAKIVGAWRIMTPFIKSK